MPERKLAFGLRQIPDDVVTCWGARLIWPCDLLHDRQDLVGRSEEDRLALQFWLNGGALRSALTEARERATDHLLRQDEDREVTLFEDETGVVKANPQSSYGYLYVAAWLKQ
jgi:hypothetical protein